MIWLSWFHQSSVNVSPLVVAAEWAEPLNREESLAFIAQAEGGFWGKRVVRWDGVRKGGHN